jgi:hypothetical protein
MSLQWMFSGMVFDTKDGEETLRILLFQKDEDDD